MKRQSVSSCIGALTTLFYVHKDSEMGIATLEHYIEIGLLNDKKLIAEIMEQTQCLDLINVIRLLDYVAAEHIEDILKGA
ncbi:hypothetical protein [Bacillus wiedmannii]|uniref:hypothetical protein n=1 Tax=Bacillus wiedmannii TaxID=1890302 RepID=UPI000BF21B7C|nr:hypothetical protein [Bacillus wiedmannii]PEN68505.1 hypothetical protein CN576_03510 [Bacillus wiedmannii]